MPRHQESCDNKERDEGSDFPKACRRPALSIIGGGWGCDKMSLAAALPATWIQRPKPEFHLNG
jgi:hypothetical protein